MSAFFEDAHGKETVHGVVVGHQNAETVAGFAQSVLSDQRGEGVIVAVLAKRRKNGVAQIGRLARLGEIAGNSQFAAAFRVAAQADGTEHQQRGGFRLR